MSNYASIKNNGYKSPVTGPRNVIGRRVLTLLVDVCYDIIIASHPLRVFSRLTQYNSPHRGPCK